MNRPPDETGRSEAFHGSIECRAALIHRDDAT